MVDDGVATPEGGWFEVYEIMRAVPPDISVEAAVLLCTWREVYAAFDDFDLKPGQDILVVGAGPVGLSFVKFARLLGLNYIGVVEIIAEKRQKAMQMGANETFAPDEAAIEQLIQKRGKPLDAVIDAVGKESIINAALPLVKMAGSVCVYGVIDQPVIQLQKHRGPYNFNLLVHQWPTRFREAAAQEPLCAWIDEGELSHTEFLSAELPIGQINHALEQAKSGLPLKTLLRF
jgi:threonine dehydrogenase-like Zn-dependent dehydrogenase